MNPSIKVAFIDSGINIKHPKFSNVNFIQRSYCESNNTIINDHGTGVFDVFRKTLNKLNGDFNDYIIYDIKVFDRSCEISLDNVIKGIEFAVNENIKVINISLGYISTTSPESLFEICKKAYDNDIIIVSAYDNKDRMCFPGEYSFCFAVTNGKINDHAKFGVELFDDRIYLIGNSSLQRVASTDKKFSFKGGTSFATGQLSAIIAATLLSNTNFTFEDLKAYLIKKSTRKIELDNLPSVTNNKHNFLFKKNDRGVEKDVFQHLFRHKEIIKKINVSIYPLSNKEFDSFIRYKENCLVNVVNYIDYPIRTYKTNIFNNDIRVKYKIEQLSDKFGSLVIGYPFEVKHKSNIDFYKKLISYCHGNNIHTYFLEKGIEYATIKIAPYLTNYSSVETSINDLEILKKLEGIRNYKVTKPVLGILGSTPKVGKFTNQLFIKSNLEKIGYKVGWLCTEPQGYFFGADYCFSYSLNENLPKVTTWPSIINNIVFAIDKFFEPDIIISGHQSSIVAHHKNAIFPDIIKNLAFIGGLMPDGVICVFNYDDSLELIERIVKSIYYYYSIPIICLVLNPIKKEYIYSHLDIPPIIIPNTVNISEWKIKANLIKNQFKIDVCQLDRKLINKITNFF